MATLIRSFVHGGVPHIVFKDPTSSGVIALPVGDGASPYAASGHKWSWDGNVDHPTLTPSVLSKKADGSVRDHFHVQSGLIKFCNDCPHENSGKTIPMLDLGDLGEGFGQ